MVANESEKYADASAPPSEQQEVPVAVAVPIASPTGGGGGGGGGGATESSSLSGGGGSGGGAPAQQATTTTTYVTTTVVHRPRRMGRFPAEITCPFCHETTFTRTKEKVGACTVVWVIVLLFIFWPLFWLPLCCRDCKTTVHTCGNCGREVGETEPCSG